MKLQIKDSGAWRNILDFQPEQCDDIETAGTLLLRAVRPTKTMLRIIDSERVIAYCEAPHCTWRMP